ncbi:MAG: virulence RhuM family protein [Spirochaetota bacterium]|uniref:virulence RhuM family protein n=1 Tax=Candidatus Avelusimicrobium faecicola TaxID=3416205 RepID=UPI002A66A394|nr:virulence RhuM family protein [Spirochaetota bacterium]
MQKDTDIIIYQTEDGKTKIEVTLADETVWLTQAQLVELFQSSKANISEHIKHIFKEGELDEKSVVRKFRTTAADGKDYSTNYYNLDVILAVGYRVRTGRGTQFRIWATQVLREYLVKGFALNDDFLKNMGGGKYWQELLARIRDIRTSEKVFYRQILDIYATSVDYDPHSTLTQEFFRVVQNKMHFAAHGHTAAEIEYLRADSEKDFMGLTSFQGEKPRKDEVLVAKNYLTADELNILNRITTAYLEFAELQALRHHHMYMKDWIAKLDDFIKMSGSELLQNPGKISKLEADNKALAEYAKYKERTKTQLSAVEKEFLESLGEIQKKLAQKKKK